MKLSCDAGGGTVDLISYKITQTKPTFRVEEAAVGSGDKCGASYIDKVWPSAGSCVLQSKGFIGISHLA
jgi:hypothetical protein